MTWGILGGILILGLRVVLLLMRASDGVQPTNDSNDALRALKTPPPAAKKDTAAPKGWRR
ncbi:hypothetical protein sos41_21750 [Alphaproteobacteria bacterium SO-S41]|nr:hypothetical protein sos41_21750 [Alphaproteobacteria bacterium SO-S41]